MAHKGQPELRIAGLDAVNGDPLSLPGLAKPAQRMSFRTELQGRMPKEEEPAKGKAAGKSKGKGAERSDERTAAFDEEADADAQAEADAPDADESSEAVAADDTSLDDVLASLSEDEPASEEAATTEATGADEAEMDPDLAALLKSLE